MKYILIFPFLFMFSILTYSQIEITSDQSNLVCPGEALNYFTFAASNEGSPCNSTYRWTVTNGVFSNGQTTIQGSYALVSNVSVIWDNLLFQGGSTIPKGFLKVQISDCAYPTNEPINFDYEVIIKTLNGVTPGNISGNPSIPIGNTSNRTFSIPRIQFPGTGQNGGSITVAYADSYQWLIPAGWKIGTLISDEV